MMSKEDYGNRIRAEREARDLTQKQMAELSAISMTTLGRIERGLQYPTIENLYAIAKTLKMAVWEFMPPSEGEVVRTLHYASEEVHLHFFGRYRPGDPRPY